MNYTKPIIEEEIIEIEDVIAASAEVDDSAQGVGPGSVFVKP